MRNKMQYGSPAIETCRNDFPALQQSVNGLPLAYLDTAASAQKPRMVLDRMSDVYELYYANVHRGLYEFSQKTTRLYEEARKKVADFLKAPSDQEIVFTRNATEGINLVAHSWGRKFLREGDEIILSGMEHHANIVPWQLLRDEIGVNLRIIPVLDDGTLDLEAFKALLTKKTRFVSVVHVSNVLGTVNPVAEIIKIVQEYDPAIVTLVDGSQGVVHSSVDISEIGCDFYTFTGHKLYGPTGIGVLWGRGDILADMRPFMGGGDMVERVTFDHTDYKPPPARFEAGTPPIVEAIGLGAAIDYVSAVGMDSIAVRERALLAQAMESLSSVEGLTFYGTAAGKAGIISFTADWAHPSDIAMILDQCGIAVRTGHHCCMPLMDRFGIDGTVRASFGMYSNADDIEAFTAGLKKAKDMLE